jgi:ligand-binding sensor domain-containing protein
MPYFECTFLGKIREELISKILNFILQVSGMNNLKRTILILCVAAAGARLSAQPAQLNFDHLPLVKGLGNRSISCILQDNMGFIWIGTQDGLLRFDGYDLKVYKSSLRNKNSLSDNNIRALAKDTLGNLWIGTQGGGLNKFNLRLEQFSHYTNDPENSNSISGNAVWSVKVDRKGNIWAGTWSNGMNVFNPIRNQFTHVNAQSSADPVLAIEEDNMGNIWYGSHGLNRVDLVSMKVDVYGAGITNGIGTSGIRAILNDRADRLWIATENSGVYQFDKTTNTFIPHQSPIASSDTKASYALFEDRNGTLWIGSNAGIELYDVASGNAHLIQHDATDALSLSNNTVRVIYADQQGSIWVGNEGGGINKVLEKKSFGLYRHFFFSHDL